MRGDGDLLDRAEEYRQKRFARLAEELEANKQRKAKEFDLLEFAVALGDEDIARFEPVSHWHGDPVTPRQSEFLTGCGINPAALKGKGHACHVIDRIMQRRTAGLATYKQVRALRRFGVPDAHLISFKRAGAILDRLFSERFAKEIAMLDLGPGYLPAFITEDAAERPYTSRGRRP